MPKYFCLLITGIILVFPACSGNPPGPKPLKKDRLLLAVAASVQFPMEKLEKAFEAQSGIEVEAIVSSSGKLTAQILQGAPYDLLIAANMKYPQNLFQLGFARQQPGIYAYGSLVLWTLKDTDLSRGIGMLADPSIEKIAIANPRNAPYGKQAKRLLQHHKLYERILPKLVYGESIAQTNQYIISKACDLGLTAKSVVLSPALKNRGRWVDLDKSAYARIEQGVVITKHGWEQHAVASEKFYNFLFSAEAGRIFEQFGYELPLN